MTTQLVTPSAALPHHIHHMVVLGSISVAQVLVEVGLVALGVVAADVEVDTAIDAMVPTREEDLTKEEMGQEVHRHTGSTLKVSREKREKALQTDMVVGAAVDMVAEEDTITDEEDGEAMVQEDHHLHLVVMEDQEGLI